MPTALTIGVRAHAFQFALDGLAPVFDYTFETFINGFPYHIFAIMAFSLSVLYIIGYNLCCPPLFVLCCGRPTTFKVRSESTQ